MTNGTYFWRITAGVRPCLHMSSGYTRGVCGKRRKRLNFFAIPGVVFRCVLALFRGVLTTPAPLRGSTYPTNQLGASSDRKGSQSCRILTGVRPCLHMSSGVFGKCGKRRDRLIFEEIDMCVLRFIERILRIPAPSRPSLVGLRFQQDSLSRYRTEWVHSPAESWRA